MSWNRGLSVFVIAVAVVAGVVSMTELTNTFCVQGLDLSVSPSKQNPSPVPFFRYSNQLSLASALFAAALTPFFFIGGVRAFCYRESGRRILAGAFALRTAWYFGCLVFWIYHLYLFADQPDIFPPRLAWGGLAAILVAGGIGALFLVILRSESTVASFAARRGDAPPLPTRRSR